MGTADTDHCLSSRRKIRCPSFRLRCPSLNSLRLRRIFDVFDKNSDGMITIGELSQALNHLGLDLGLPELETMIQSYIQQGNPGLRFEDFEALHRSLEEEVEDDCTSASEDSDLAEAFKVFDEDGDGYISARELQVVLGKLGLHDEGREIAKVELMISSVDCNRDGRVDFLEFKNMMRSVPVKTCA